MMLLISQVSLMLETVYIEVHFESRFQRQVVSHGKCSFSCSVFSEKTLINITGGHQGENRMIKMYDIRCYSFCFSLFDFKL